MTSYVEDDAASQAGVEHQGQGKDRGQDSLSMMRPRARLSNAVSARCRSGNTWPTAATHGRHQRHIVDISDTLPTSATSATHRRCVVGMFGISLLCHRYCQHRRHLDISSSLSSSSLSLPSMCLRHFIILCDPKPSPNFLRHYFTLTLTPTTRMYTLT